MALPRPGPPTPATHGTLDARVCLGGFRLTETTHGAGMRLPRHAHADDAITLVLRGDFAESFGGRAVACRRGGLLVKPAGAAHTNRYGARGARSLLIDVADAPATVRDTPERARVMAAAYDGVRYFAAGPANALALRVADELRALDDPARLAVEGLLLELLAALARARPAEPERHTPDDPAWLRRAVDYLHAHPGDAVRLGALAAAAETTPARLVRAFRRRFGETPGGYQRRLRVEHARGELLHTARPLAAIAASAGFTDQSHFTRAFVRTFGTTPGAYRRDARSR